MDAEMILNAGQTEDVLLGAMIAYGEECLNLVRAVGLTEADFYKGINKTLFREIMKMADRGEAVELNTVAANLQKDGLAERVTLMQLTQLEAVAHPQDAKEPQVKKYAAVLKDFAARRKLIEAGGRLKEDAQDMNKDVAAIVAEAQDSITASTIHDERRTYQPMQEHMLTYLETLGQREQGITGALPTGIKGLDERCGGFSKGHFIVLAARPSMGKSALALNIATNVCKAGGKVVFFSMEMPVQDLMDRIIASETNTNYKRLQRAQIEPKEWDKVYKKADEMTKYHLALYTGKLTMAEIRMRSELAKAKEKGLDLVVIDHLQLIEPEPGKRYGNRTNELSEITGQLKDMALAMNVPVLALSQLSRANETRDNKRPQLFDMRESGSIEQDADMVLALYRDAYYTGDQNDRTAELGVLKARGGIRGGCVNLTWKGEYQKFETAMK